MQLRQLLATAKAHQQEINAGLDAHYGQLMVHCGSAENYTQLAQELAALKKWPKLVAQMLERVEDERRIRTADNQ